MNAHPLIAHIHTLTGQLPSREEELLSYFEAIQVRKKEILVQEGQYCRKYFFVMKGCLRLYFQDQAGVEQTVQFALENWWLTDLAAFKKGTKSRYSIQALESADLLVISPAQMQGLLSTFPIMDSYFRLIYERAYDASLHRIRLNYMMQKKNSM